MNKFAQALIIKNNSILYKTKHNDNGSITNQPICRELNEGELPEQGLEQLIREQLNTSSKIVFRLGKEMFGNTSTFFVDIENIDSIEEVLEKKGFRWVSLFDRDSFTYNEKLQLSYLLIACVENNISDDWMKPVQDMVAADIRLGDSNSILMRKMRGRDHKNTDSSTQAGEKLLAISIAVILGFIYNMFFHSRAWGISYPIFTGIIILVFLYFLRKRGSKVSLTGGSIMALAFIISMNYAIHSNMLINFLNSIAVPLLLTASFILIRYEAIEWGSIKFVISVFDRIIPSAFENMLKPFIFIKGRVKRRDKGKLNPQTKSILAGLLVSIPLLLIILPLLSSADSVFGYYTSNFYTVFRKINIGDTLSDIIRILVIALYLFGFLWSFKYSFHRDTKPLKLNGKLEPITVLTVLIIINLVYLFFTVVQFSYLYGGETALPNGFTYAEYARRGFFELVLVTMINFTLLISATMFTKKENTIKSILNAAYTLLVIFTSNMLFSAHFKMSLYESAFGYTYLRIFVHFFLLLLFILFVIVLAGIWIKKIPVARLSIIAALLMYVIINYVNVDSIIVQKNIERYNTTGKIDVNYLSSLSYDAVPQVIGFSINNSDNISLIGKLNDYAVKKRESLNKDTAWFEFNYSKFRALQILKQSINNEN